MHRWPVQLCNEQYMTEQSNCTEDQSSSAMSNTWLSSQNAQKTSPALQWAIHGWAIRMHRRPVQLCNEQYMTEQSECTEDQSSSAMSNTWLSNQNAQTTSPALQWAIHGWAIKMHRRPVQLCNEQYMTEQSECTEDQSSSAMSNTWLSNQNAQKTSPALQWAIHDWAIRMHRRPVQLCNEQYMAEQSKCTEDQSSSAMSNTWLSNQNAQKTSPALQWAINGWAIRMHRRQVQLCNEQYMTKQSECTDDQSSSAMSNTWLSNQNAQKTSPALQWAIHGWAIKMHRRPVQLCNEQYMTEQSECTEDQSSSAMSNTWLSNQNALTLLYSQVYIYLIPSKFPVLFGIDGLWPIMLIVWLENPLYLVATPSKFKFTGAWPRKTFLITTLQIWLKIEHAEYMTFIVFVFLFNWQGLEL